MAVVQMNATSSFQHVVDNVPSWKTQLANLTTYAAGRHGEFIAEYSRLLHQARTKRKRSASVASIHSSDDEVEIPEASEQPLKSPSPSVLAEINPLEAGNRFIYAQAHRKRKPGTSMRSDQTNPRPYRSKQMVVIYYDSHIQSELDKLVKGFGAARNNLRKGKNAYVAAKGFTLPSLSRRYETAAHRVSSKPNPCISKASGETLTRPTTNPVTGEAAFARIDKELEAIQSLCETAAHQAIRDGDCKAQLTEVSSNMNSLLALAQSTLDLLDAEKQKDEAGETRIEDAVTTDDTSSQSTLVEKPSVEAMSLSHKMRPSHMDSVDVLKRSQLPTMIMCAPSGLLTTDEIEVDDDDDDSSSYTKIDLNITRFRAGSRLIS